MIDRTISACSHKFVSTNCKKCGIYNHSYDPAVKTNNFESYLNCSSLKYLKHMRKRQCKQIQGKEISQYTYALLQSICDKFQYTLQTLALGIYIYGKTCESQKKDEKFWASTALIVASKGIQLDKRVPYLNRYQRYADKEFTQEDYQLAEKTIFEQLDFDLQYSTFVTFLHFYLTNGVLFKSDGVNTSILKYIEDDMVEKARDYVKTGEFLSHPPEKLALSIVREIREKFRLQPWKPQLETISGYSENQIKLIEKNSILKPLNNVHFKNKQKMGYNISLTPLGINSLQSSVNFGEDKLNSGKKKLQSTLRLQNIKQNSSQMVQDFPLSNLRNQVVSLNKYRNFTSSCERIIPLNSFINKRL